MCFWHVWYVTLFVTCIICNIVFDMYDMQHCLWYILHATLWHVRYATLFVTRMIYNIVFDIIIYNIVCDIIRCNIVCDIIIYNIVCYMYCIQHLFLANRIVHNAILILHVQFISTWAVLVIATTVHINGAVRPSIFFIPPRWPHLPRFGCLDPDTRYVCSTHRIFNISKGEQTANSRIMVIV